MPTETIEGVRCYHCKQYCEDIVSFEGKSFCCIGCKAVFELLNENQLCDYYALAENPGIHWQTSQEKSYAYLDEPSIRKKVVEFDSASFARIGFFAPAIHCISCVWLLENLQRIQPGVLKSEVNFSSRRVLIDFNPSKVSPGQLAQRLASLGYAPQINLEGEGTKREGINKPLITKLAIAGFVFGNVMLLSFPEYLGLDESDSKLRSLFSYLNILLAVPVVTYSARDYFTNAWKSFSQRQINIDVPIALGLLALFSRSLYDILSHHGSGYLDSLTGLVFFLLIGRWFQDKTYQTLAFDRDYKSYFPLAVQKFNGSDWSPVIIYDLQIGNRIRVKNLEIIPADSNLLASSAFIDYSFVTGESRPVKVSKGERVFAGGKLIGEPVELIVAKKTSQGHLTTLWNNPIFQKPEERGYRKTIDLAAKRFTWVILVLAFLTTVVWYVYDPSRVWLVLTSVLMVACPCALALAAPFTYGSFLRAFGRNELYMKNADVIERMASIDAVVFDKTGTVTYDKSPHVSFVGHLNKHEYGWVKTVTSFSTHPLSNLISGSIKKRSTELVSSFGEHPGRGIHGNIGNHVIKIGSSAFVGAVQNQNLTSTSVFVSIDGEIRGYFSIAITTRKNLAPMIQRLGHKCVALISGDTDTDKGKMRALFGPDTQLIFNQSPADKLHFIKELQEEGKKVMMVGDGLNDAGALKQSNVGIAVTDDTAVFTPASDGILQGNSLELLDRFLSVARYSSTVLKVSFAISFLYNSVALLFAVSGHLTPLVAAILMPISSISVVSFSTLAARYVTNKKLKVV